MPNSQNTNTNRGGRLMGAGLAIMIVWGVMTFAPDKITPWANSALGKELLFWFNIGLFAAAVGSFVYVFSDIASKRKLKLKSISIKGVKIDFDNKEDSTDISIQAGEGEENEQS